MQEEEYTTPPPQHDVFDPDILDDDPEIEPPQDAQEEEEEPQTEPESAHEAEEEDDDPQPPVTPSQFDGSESATTTSQQRRALVEFRDKVEEAILSDSLNFHENNVDDPDSKEIMLWGIPLLPSAGHKGTDAVLTKFLKAKRYKVHKAFNLLQQTLIWRETFAPSVVSRNEADNLCFVGGRDKEGRPLFYTVLSKESRRKFVNTYLDYFRWRIRCVERGIQTLDFSPGGVDSFIQIIDFKNAHVLAVV